MKEEEEECVLNVEGCRIGGELGGMSEHFPLPVPW